jgi:acyl carrier protein
LKTSTRAKQTNVETWIINWFKQNADLKSNDITKNLFENYLEKGWIDSLKFISFISDIEGNFGIRFSNDEFQDRAFATIAGLSKIIHNKINEK